ncbi:MAG: hypothetical protein QXI16_06325 [Sulfolobaceae archaeon]
MKKITSIILMIALSLFITLKISASVIDTQIIDITEQFNSWTLEENSGVYMLKSNRIKNAAESIQMQLDTVFTSSDQEFIDGDGDGIFDEPNPYYNLYDAFVMSYGSETSRINVYASDTTTTLLYTVNMTYEAFEATEAMYLNDGTMADPDWDVNLAPNVYYSVTIVLNETLNADQRQRILDVFNSGGAWGSMIPGETYNFTVTANVVSVYIDPSIPSDLDLLPTTGGSIFDDVNNMADVSVDVLSGNTVDLSIIYDTIYYVRYTFSENTDMTIFNDNYEAFYYTHEDQHFIVFNKGEQSMFTHYQSVETFIPYTIWNLDTNELVEHNQVDVYMYMTLGDANHIVGYFYVDEFVIDRLMQISTVFNYRFDPLIGAKSEWISQAAILEDTGISEGNISWQFTAAATSSAAVATMAIIIGATGVGLPIALPLALFGSLVTGFFLANAYMYPGSLITGDTSEIQIANVSTELQTEINQKYAERNPDFTSIDTNTYPLWKLDFGAFERFGSTTEVDPDSINVISLTYQTDGQVYTLEADKIRTDANVDDYLDPNHDSTIIDPYPTEPSTSSDSLIYYAIGGIIIYIVFFKEMKLHKKPITLIVLIGIAYYILKTLGVL